MNLYEIESAILDCIDQETGEVIDIDKLEQLSMERDTKVENIALWIKNLKAEAEAYKAEKQSFEQKQKVAENKMESLKKYLADYLGGTKFQTTKVSCSFCATESVLVPDISALPDEYKRYKDPEPNKEEIKKAFKRGIRVPGAGLVSNLSLIIK